MPSRPPAPAQSHLKKLNITAANIYHIIYICVHLSFQLSLFFNNIKSISFLLISYNIRDI
jgi:hypothetical protein